MTTYGDDGIRGQGASSRAQAEPRLAQAASGLGGTHPLRPHHWMTADWRSRRALYLKRLGDWVAMTRKRLGMSLLEVERAARQDGEDLSQTLVHRLEQMRTLPPDANVARKRVSWTAIAWLASASGQTLADVDRYLRSGETTDLEPSVEARADSVRAAFLALSPVRRQSLEEFAQHLYQLDMLEHLSEPAVGTAEVAPTAAIEAAHQQVLDDVRQQRAAATTPARRAQRRQRAARPDYPMRQQPTDQQENGQRHAK